MQAVLSIVVGHAAGIDFNIGAGLTTGAGIKDDSISIKLLGCGLIFGRKMGLSFFDNSFAVDFGKVLDGLRRDEQSENADLDAAKCVLKPLGDGMQGGVAGG